MAYVWIKTFHLVFVIAWMASVFYLPRILVNIAEAGEVAGVRERLVLMGRRLYRFGHVMFAIAVVLGLVLSFGYGVIGPWLHAKLALVVLIFAMFVVSGRWLRNAVAGRALPGATALRWFNEVPVVLLVGVVYLVLAKPF